MGSKNLPQRWESFCPFVRLDPKYRHFSACFEHSDSKNKSIFPFLTVFPPNTGSHYLLTSVGAFFALSWLFLPQMCSCLALCAAFAQKHEYLTHSGGALWPHDGGSLPFLDIFDANNTQFLLFNTNIHQNGMLIIILAIYTPIRWIFFPLFPIFFPKYDFFFFFLRFLGQLSPKCGNVIPLLGWKPPNLRSFC